VFWDGVAEDVIADLLTAVGIGSVTVAVAYWRFSGHFERFRQCSTRHCFLHAMDPRRLFAR